MARIVTVQRHLIETQSLHADATGDLTRLLWDLTIAFKMISRAVNKAGLINILGLEGETNASGDEVKKLDDIMQEDTGNMPSMIQPKSGDQDQSSFLRDSHSFILPEFEKRQNIKDEYEDDDDVGFDLYEVGQKDFRMVAQQIAEKYDYPKNALDSGKKSRDEFVLFNTI